MPEIMPWHLTQLVNPEFTRVDLVKEGANSQAHIKLFKHREEHGMNPIEELLSKMKPEHQLIVKNAIDAATALIPADVQTQIANLEKAKKDAEEALENANIAKSAEASEEDILKSVKDPAVRALLETQIAKTKAAEAIVRKQAEEKLEAEAIAKAHEVSAIGATPEQLANIYKGLADKPELREDVFGIFKAANAVANAGGVFTQVGKSAHESEVSTGSADNAWTQIEKAAKEFEKAGTSKAQAIAKAVRANPELYAAYVNGQ